MADKIRIKLTKDQEEFIKQFCMVKHSDGTKTWFGQFAFKEIEDGVYEYTESPKVFIMEQ